MMLLDIPKNETMSKGTHVFTGIQTDYSQLFHADLACSEVQLSIYIIFSYEDVSTRGNTFAVAFITLFFIIQYYLINFSNVKFF
jgi:hypothetical protein